MAIDRTAERGSDRSRWRDEQEIRALREMVGIYRRQATSLAADVTSLRAEGERLRDSRGGRLIEVEIDLDEHAEDLVSAVLLGELADLPAQELEDVLLVARELAAGGVRRSAGRGRAMLRVERSPASLRVAIQESHGNVDSEILSAVECLSERWGTEQVASGGTTVWAQLAPMA
jgi:hypothetical protein